MKTKIRDQATIHGKDGVKKFLDRCINATKEEMRKAKASGDKTKEEELLAKYEAFLLQYRHYVRINCSPVRCTAEKTLNHMRYL